ncbi:MAG: KTSC domain-containing protein [Acidobacteria bacterium]|nr:KTSC domain-containing protein [Acidobacteriota bacterium]
MTRQRVSSSSIRSVGYDPENRILEIELKHGGIYQYFEVPEEVHSDLKAAASVGRYYTKYVRNICRFRKIK